MNKKNKNRFDAIETWIGADTVFTGDIGTSKSIRIDGKLIGDIKESSNVVLGETAEIKGNIKTKYIVVGGIIEGNIIASEGIELLNNSKVVGDISTAILSIGEGAVFEGRSSMLETEEKTNEETK